MIHQFAECGKAQAMFCSLFTVRCSLLSWNFYETPKHWNIETMKHWNIETLKHWNLETLKHWNLETLELQQRTMNQEPGTILEPRTQNSELKTLNGIPGGDYVNIWLKLNASASVELILKTM